MPPGPTPNAVAVVVPDQEPVAVKVALLLPTGVTCVSEPSAPSEYTASAEQVRVENPTLLT